MEQSRELDSSTLIDNTLNGGRKVKYLTKAEEKLQQSRNVSRKVMKKG